MVKATCYYSTGCGGDCSAIFILQGSSFVSFACFFVSRVSCKLSCSTVVVDSCLLTLHLSQSYVGEMRTKLAVLFDQTETSLEASLPEVQRQFNQLHSELKTGNEAVLAKVEGLGTKFERSLESRPTRTELAADFAEIARRLAGGGAAIRRTSTTTTTRTTTRTTTTDDGGDDEQQEEEEDFQRASQHLIRIRDIDEVDQIYYEFKGLTPLFEGAPIAGGLEACDRRWKARWRRHFSSSDQKRFSRMAMLTKAIDKEVHEEGERLADVLAKFDHYFREKKRSFCGLISVLQAEGYLERKGPRTKRRLGQSPGEGGGGGQPL
jgi:hypothetical protein